MPQHPFFQQGFVAGVAAASKQFSERLGIENAATVAQADDLQTQITAAQTQLDALQAAFDAYVASHP